MGGAIVTNASGRSPSTSASPVSSRRMACGLPVLVSENTAGPEVVRDGSQEYVVPIRDPDSIAERLRERFENPEGSGRRAEARRKSPRSSSGMLTVGIAEALRSAD